MEFVSYFDIERETEALINDAKNSNFTDEEILIILSYLKTLKNSAYCWLPEEKGGSGAGYLFLTNNRKDKTPVGEAVLADCKNAALGMIGIAVVGALTGGAGAAALIYLAGESAAASLLEGAITAASNSKTTKIIKYEQ